MTSFFSKALSVVFVLALVFAPVSGLAATQLPDPVSRMYDALAKVSSIRANTIVNVKLSAEGKSMDLALAVDTVTDTKDKVEIGFTLTASSNAPEFREALGATTATAKGTLRVISNKKAYVYFSDLPNIPSSGFNTQKLEGKWIDLTSDIAARDIVTFSGKKETFAESIQRMKAALVNYPAFTFKEEGSSTSEYRYKLTLNPTYLASFVRAANSENISIGALDASDLAALKSVTGYITIDRLTYLPKTATGIAVVRDNVGISTDLSITASVSSTYTAFNEKVNLSKPTKVVSLEKLMKDLMGPAAADAEARVNFGQARATAEIYYDEHGSYEGLCSSRNMKGYLKLAGKTACYASQNEFALSTKLSSGYYCADSTGDVQMTKKQAVSKKDLTCN